MEDKSDIWALSAQFKFSVCEYLTKAYFTSKQSLACMSTLKKVVQEKHSKSIRSFLLQLFTLHTICTILSVWGKKVLFKLEIQR